MPLLTPTVNGQYASTPAPEPAPPLLPHPVSRVRRVPLRRVSWLVLGWLLVLSLYAGLLVAQPQGTEPPVSPVVEKPTLVWANRRSGIYHLPHCPNYPAMPGRHWEAFPTREAAERAGYRAARNCGR